MRLGGSWEAYRDEVRRVLRVIFGYLRVLRVIFGVSEGPGRHMA